MAVIFAFLIFGAFVGMLAGLLGIGGGVILVPILSFIFPKLGLPIELVMQVSLGTSIGCTLFSMMSSTMGHFKHGKINLPVFYKLLPGLLIGGALGPIIAHNLDYNSLKNLFAALLFFISLKMLFEDMAKRRKRKKTLPNKNIFEERPKKVHFNNIFFLVLSGVTISTISALLGIGGGILLLSLFSFMNIRMKEAVGTAAICGVAINFVALIGYIVSGLQVMPNYDLYIGYIYLPALLAISLTSVIFAQISAYQVQKIPGKMLKQILAGVLIFTAGRMFW